MFCIGLSTNEIGQIGSAPGAAYQSARWILQFHESRYFHVGMGDHSEGTPVAPVLEKYGFVRVPRFELNQVRLLLETYGPLLIQGSFSHLAHNEVPEPIPEMPLVRVSSYQEGAHALILNGYRDGFVQTLLYRDAAHPERQFVEEVPRLWKRLDPEPGILYLNCTRFPKPCPHVPRPPKKASAPQTESDEAEPQADAE